jgi:hypothetical protein
MALVGAGTNEEAIMIARRKRLARAQADAGNNLRARWATPTVHTLLDLVPVPASGVRPQDPAAHLVVREWDLLGFGVLMTTDGVLHSLDPVAYRTWQLHKQHSGVDAIAHALVDEWDVEIDKARRDVLVVLRRLKETDAAASA